MSLKQEDVRVFIDDAYEMSAAISGSMNGFEFNAALTVDRVQIDI
ncbi:hypothetical protein [Vibrio harveyi]|nr:hypothetical protein [Vibrio harveyi]